jgi:hypothetical protein
MEKQKRLKFFDERLQPGNFNKKLLPFFHSCDAYIFREIIEGGTLSPSMCPRLNETLLYLFYGRPAYKNPNDFSSGLHALLPTAFILKADSIDKIKRISPFDTGAFTIGLFKEFLHDAMSLDNFFITPRKEAISKIISYFFASNENYFDSKPKIDIKFNQMEFEIQAYHEIIKKSSQGKLDDRRASIEVQLGDEVSLADSLEAVIIPEIFIQDVEGILGKGKVKIIKYVSRGIPSDNYYSEVLSLTRDYLINKKYLRAHKQKV